MTLLEAYHSDCLLDFHRLAARAVQEALETPRDVDRQALSKAVCLYLQSLGAPKAAQAAAQQLAHPESRVVMTGQQAGLLLGPVFTISKAVNAILLARAWHSEERPVLPVFWVASQDHDADEVRSAHLLDLNERLHTLSLDLPPHLPMGRVPLRPEWLEATLATLRDFEAPEDFKHPVLESVERCFRSSSHYAEWFSKLLLEVLGPQGLIVVDPMHPAIAELFVPHLERELAAPLASSQAIEDAASKLEALGYAAQLRRAAGSSNLFLQGEDDERRLLKWNGQEFSAERPYSPEEIKAILHSDPSRVTPAAGLRPIIADATFPVAVNILGPGELAYHLELGGVYTLHAVPQPLMHQRLSVTFLEPPVARILKKYDLTAQAFVRNGKATLETKLLAQTSAAEGFRAALDDLETNFTALHQSLTPFEDGLGKALAKSENSLRFNLERLRHKLGGALLRAEDAATGQFSRLGRHLLPLGAPQERTVSFLEFVMKFGTVPLERMFKLEPSGAQVIEI